MPTWDLNRKRKGRKELELGRESHRYRDPEKEERPGMGHAGEQAFRQRPGRSGQAVTGGGPMVRTLNFISHPPGIPRRDFCCYYCCLCLFLAVLVLCCWSLALSICGGSQASHCGDCSCCRAQDSTCKGFRSSASRALEHGLSGCGTRA